MEVEPDVENIDVGEIDYLVPNYLIRGGVHSVTGPSGVGKTRYISLLMACLATGRGDVMGVEAVPPMRTMYIANEEAAEDVRRRIKVAKLANGLTGGMQNWVRGGKDSGVLRLTKVEDGVYQRDLDQVDRLVEIIKSKQIEVLVFDPFNTMGADNENDTVSVVEVMEAMRDIAREAKVTIIFVHHTPKTRGEVPDALRGSSDAWRGSGAIYSALDGGWTLCELLPDGMTRGNLHKLRQAQKLGRCSKYVVIDQGKVREGEDMPPVAYRMFGVEPQAGARQIGALQMIDAGIAVEEMQMVIEMDTADRNTALADEWGGALIAALGEGDHPTNMQKIHRILSSAKAGEWPTADRIDTSGPKAKQLVDLFKAAVEVTGHTIRITKSEGDKGRKGTVISIKKVAR